MLRTGGRSVRAVICACFYVIGAIRLVWCLAPGMATAQTPVKGVNVWQYRNVAVPEPKKDTGN
jgi:hypothetical protein